LDFGEAMVGVTAAHVVEQFLQAKRCTPTMECRLSDTALDLENSIIQSSHRRDIATFSISRDHANATGGYALDCRDNWRPPVPNVDDPIHLIGLPLEMRKWAAGENPRFGAWGALAMVEDVTSARIVVKYDPKECLSLLPNRGLHPLKLNLSGCSGGPALLARIKNGSVFYHAVGLVAAGPGATFEGLMADFDIIHILRIHDLNLDGTFDDPEPGWLPA
jgi:hypothetical protein